ncbi:MULTISPECIES: helix-turn-helix transcriptional regulator [Bacillus]|uniref:helix-turn-helix transcriptional regulator n=1 Tax=Bacillus TaxID=1386 RepID=UPI000BF79013|nr:MULTISPECIES: helix-turn-helix transcriptional regulator [Bacillus]MCU5742440.1 helix-turn-helix transcriptional regulator [Bacillus cereus]MCU9577455.1 helix-turn-helix transcriptional regulator [Bacillus cereus]PFA84559.1 transcriptional regulator [Bacillus cereus]PFB77114.1 transcriptional regulator [Bacillus thuringiensis]PGN42335.1 transcriptional regulator [Bacillus thuringiensis]
MKNKINYPQKNLYKEIASYCGVTERYIRMIDQKERTPSMETAKKIAKFFDMNIDDIFFSSKSNFKFFLAACWSEKNNNKEVS